MTAAQFSREDIIKYEGYEQGMEQGINAMILDNLEDGKTEEVIINKLVRRFKLTEEEAKGYLKACVDKGL